MSTMPSQLFSQNLQSGMDHYVQQQNLRRSQDALKLQSDALELQREGEARRVQDQAQDEAFRRDQLEETKRYHGLLDQNRADELELRRQAAEAKSLMQAQESQAAMWDYANLMGNERTARFVANDVVGPPPDGPVGMDDPSVQAFGGMSDTMQRLVRNQKASEVAKLQMQIEGKSDVQRLLREEASTREALKGVSDNDQLNKTILTSRLFKINQALTEVAIGAKKVSTGPAEGFSQYMQHAMPKEPRPQPAPSPSSMKSLMDLRMERDRLAAAMAPVEQNSFFNPYSDKRPPDMVAIDAKGEVKVPLRDAKMRLVQIDAAIAAASRGIGQQDPGDMSVQPVPFGAGPAPMSPTSSQFANPTPEQKDQMYMLMDQGMSYDEARVKILGR